MTAATESKKFTCPECGRDDFKAATGLGAHRASAHGVAGAHKDTNKQAKARRKRRTTGAVHPPLGATMRVTSLGEQPGGTILMGLADSATGKIWLATINEVSR